MLKTQSEIKNHYDSENLIQGYIRNRFENPLGKFLHERETSIVNKFISRYEAKKVLDLACGPGRLTVDINAEKGFAFDHAKNMLKIAKKRLEARDKTWTYLQGDAFKLKLKDKFDLIYSFRFFRHFDEKDRKKLLKNVYNHLDVNGIFITDMANLRFRDRSIKSSSEKIQVVDFKIRKKDFIKELEDAGFKILEVETVINHYNFQVNASRLHYLKLDTIAMSLIREFERYPPVIPQEFVFIAIKK